MDRKTYVPKLFKIFVLMLVYSQTTSCYFVDFIDFFQSKTEKSSVSANATTDQVLGQYLGSKAGTVDEAALEAVYGMTSAVPPAPIRADPDMYARRLLLQYREEGSTVAREIGAIEGYRLLLGGASSDFQKKPQEGFDATSLLANLTVAERICTGLVSPDPNEHEGWETILPAPAEAWHTNILFLAQRFIGKPSTSVSEETIARLREILDAYNQDGAYGYDDYVPVCTSLALDAEALLL